VAERPLRDRIDVAVGAEQGRYQEGAAEQALGVAHGGGGDVDAGALRRERRHIGGDHHGRHIAGANLLAADIDAKPLEHALQGLLGEWRVVERIAGTVEADHKAIADQLVLTNTLDIREVLDARSRSRARPRARQHRQRNQRRPKRPLHLLLPKRSDG
jgi:hypothetical protein